MSAHKLIDTNILVYAFDSSEGEKHRKAKALLERCLKREESFFLSTQNISEFYQVVTRKIEHPIPKREALEICKKLVAFSGFVKISPEPPVLLDAMKLDSEHGADYWDALIAATMRANGVSTIINENGKDFRKIPGIAVENPFA
jgi:predicted nucleic acid-binding protein